MGRMRKFASDQARSAAYNEAHRAEKVGGAVSGSLPLAMSVAKTVKKKFAKGGMVGAMKENYDDSGMSLADSIRKKKKMADGGMVDLEENQEEHPNGYDDLNEDAGMDDPLFDEDLSADPMDSNEMGDDIDKDDHDQSVVGMIRKKMKSVVG